jgi:hypothetical protein
VVDAGTGAVVPPPDDAAALRSAQVFLSGANGVLQGRTQDDRWTHSASLDPHRPLIKVLMDDSASSLLYISSTTAEVVMDVPRHQRYWNYVGAWLHWVYMLREGSKTLCGAGWSSASRHWEPSPPLPVPWWASGDGASTVATNLEPRPVP